MSTFAELWPHKRTDPEQSLSDGKQEGLRRTRHNDMFDVPTEKARSMKTAPGMTPKRCMSRKLDFFLEMLQVLLRG